MTIKHMKIFIKVYENMNITKASEQLYMTQPAVTRAIKELESYYGIKLFERINHRLYRTESGFDFYQRAIHIVDSFDILEKKIKNWDELGVLRIGASITLGNFIMPYVINEFQKLHPLLKIKVNIANGGLLVQALLNNSIDIALIEGNVSDENFICEKLTEDRLILIMAKNHPLNSLKKIYLKDISECPILLRENGSAGRSFLDSVFAAHGYTAIPTWESESSQALIKAVSYGIGISILPDQLVQEDILSGNVVTRTVEDEPFIRNNYIVWHKNKYITKSAKHFVQLCHEYIEK